MGSVVSELTSQKYCAFHLKMSERAETCGGKGIYKINTLKS
jgi:hypothetical protein